jgi:hypothetical protein
MLRIRTHMIDEWHRAVCRVKGHDWRELRSFPRGCMRLCRRCPAVETDWRSEG